ncbi:flagellin [Thermomonas sp.]|uniref:flagellin N-terminal helical domain-containing protein n=1 Tax=Thermomonas sp. TaxID=1971895 RepID=UPI0035B002A6
MANSVNTNIMSLNAQRNLYTSSLSQATTIQRLSSGLRVNSAKDDAAGLAIAERMNAQIRGNNVAIRNANDGISLAQTAEGALGKIGDSLQRMRELAVQSANATNSSDDRTNLQSEFTQLQEEISRVVGGTTFNGTSLFTGSTSFSFQVGAGTTSNDVVSVARNQLSGGTAGSTGGLTSSDSAQDVIATVTASSGSKITGTDGTNATNAIKDIDVALDKLNAERATYGAAQNRFDSVIGNLQITVENASAARSRIMDTDFAAETASLTRTQILTQAGTAMLAQANQAPQSVLSLLR